MLVHNECSKTRKAALREAKSDAGIPKTQQPQKVEKVKMTSAESTGSYAILDDKGKVIYTREYHYTNTNGGKIIIQDHGAGHQFANGIGNQGSHFNVRPANNPRTGKVKGTLGHYPFDK